MKKVKVILVISFFSFLTMNIITNKDNKNDNFTLKALSASANGFAECSSGVGHCCCGSWWSDTCYCDGTVYSYSNMCTC